MFSIVLNSFESIEYSFLVSGCINLYTLTGPPGLERSVSTFILAPGIKPAKPLALINFSGSWDAETPPCPVPLAKSFSKLLNKAPSWVISFCSWHRTGDSLGLDVSSHFDRTT